MLLLRSTGVDPADPMVVSAVARCETNLRWNNNGGGWNLRPPETGGNQFFEGEVEPCINGGVLAIGAYFRNPDESLAHRLLHEQLDDGGWNCEAPKSTHSSFHTTICVLEGLLEYERSVEPGSQISSKIGAARYHAEEYLLERALFRRRSTGEIANPQFLELAFPPRYHYDILRALDYFRAAELTPDLRMEGAVRLLESKRSAGRWLLDRAYDEPLACATGESVAEPSLWNTLRAMRVVRWFRRMRPE